MDAVKKAHGHVDRLGEQLKNNIFFALFVATGLHVPCCMPIKPFLYQSRHFTAQGMGRTHFVSAIKAERIQVEAVPNAEKREMEKAGCVLGEAHKQLESANLAISRPVFPP